MESKYLTIQTRVVFPCTFNDNYSLFGGMAMKWMDEVAYMTATRYTRNRMVTISVEKVEFLIPVKEHSIVEIRGIIEKKTNSKVIIKVEINCEEMYSSQQCLAVRALFEFASVDENNQPIPIKEHSEKL